MILFQIIAGILLIPLLLVLPLVYCISIWRWQYFISVFGYFCLIALAISTISKTPWFGMMALSGLCQFYAFRLWRLHRAATGKTIIKSAIYGTIHEKRKREYVAFYFPFSILKFIARIPGLGTKKIGTRLSLNTFLNLFIKHSSGTKIKITDPQANINIHIN